MFAEAATTASTRAPDAPCWDVLRSRYSDDATDQSDDESPAGEPCEVERSSAHTHLLFHAHKHTTHDEESEDEDDALESAVWAAIQNGATQM